MIKVLISFLTISNPFVRWLLQSRFHRLLSGNVVMLEVIGRKSGRIYLVPINYRKSPGDIWMMTYRRRLWWRNLRQIDELPVFFKGKKLVTKPEVVTDNLDVIARSLTERSRLLRCLVRATPEESVLIRLRFAGQDETT